jgi:RNA polymerase sigma factor (sigma-70 family)
LITLNDIAKRHVEWVKISKYVGAKPDEIDDIIQTMYLKLGEIQLKEGSLDRFANYNGTINTIYLFKMIHNAFIDIKRAENKTIPHQDEFNPVESPEMAEYAHGALMDEVKKAIDELRDYDQMLLELHFVYGHSMRDIEKRTGIPTHSVFNSIKNAKQFIKQRTKTKYQIYAEEKRNTETIYRITTIHRVGGHDSEGNESNGD